MNSNKAYLTNLAAAVTGQQGFIGNPRQEENVYATAVAILLFYILFLIVFGIGAARLSYNYNISVGHSAGAAMAYAILNFFFSSFYYPFYALVLDPLGKRRR